MKEFTRGLSKKGGGVWQKSLSAFERPLEMFGPAAPLGFSLSSIFAPVSPSGTSRDVAVLLLKPLLPWLQKALSEKPDGSEYNLSVVMVTTKSEG